MNDVCDDLVMLYRHPPRKLSLTYQHHSAKGTSNKCILWGTENIQKPLQEDESKRQLIEARSLK